MNPKATLALVLVLAALVAVIAWQWMTISSLEDRLETATAALQSRPPANASPRIGRPGPLAAASPATTNGIPSAPAATNRSDSTASSKAARDEKRAAFERQLADARRARAAELPPALTSERRRTLMEGRELFNPGPIDESTVPVTAQTLLQPGQALQVKYGETWYTAEVVGFESDGGIHIRYFGWGPSWDEIVPREDLRVDPQARERAVEKFGASSGNG